MVTGTRQKAALSVIESVAREKKAPLYPYGSAFRVRRTSEDRFTYYGILNEWERVRTGLSGTHQIRNAALILAACECLMKKKVSLTETHIKTGLLDTKWPGRLEVVMEKPLVILDGAHNFMAARALKAHLNQVMANRNVTMVIGILDDKPYRSMLKSLLPGCKRVIVTQARIDRALPPEILRDMAKSYVSNVKIIPNVADAVSYAINTTPKIDAVCVAGSLYVVGEAKEALQV